MSAPTMPYRTDGDLSLLSDLSIAIIGYGSQGHAHALNLRDSGMLVMVGARPGRSWDRATESGFEVCPVHEAAARADLIALLVNDEFQPAVFEESIAPHLNAGKRLVFAHGFAIHFGFIQPPPDIDVILVAPKGPGRLIRKLFSEGLGVPALVAVHQNATGQALEVALSYAKGIGGPASGAIETSFKQECETDLFGEQAVLCGGMSALVKAAFETLVEAGYPPELAYFECLHELKLTVDLMHESGISGMRKAISDTAQFGDLTRGPRLIGETVRAEMKQVLQEIQSGQFAREWMEENRAGRPRFNSLTQTGQDHPIEAVGEAVRALMPWMQNSKKI